MVKRILLILTFCLLPAAARAAEFTATVDSNQVQAGQPFTLDLTLSGAQAKSDPDLSALKRDFIVAGEGKTSNTSIINGSVTSSVGWELSLIAKGQGRIVVPRPVARHRRRTARHRRDHARRRTRHSRGAGAAIVPVPDLRPGVPAAAGRWRRRDGQRDGFARTSL